MSPPPVPSRARFIPIVLAQVFGFACGVVGVQLNSHLIPPELLGDYGVFLSFAPMGMWVVHAGLVKYVARHWAADASIELLKKVATAWAKRLPWLAGATGAAALLMATSAAAAAPGLWLVLFTSASLLSLAALMQAGLQARRAHWRDGAVAAVGSLSRTFVPPLLFLILGGTDLALRLGFCAHALAIAVAGAWALHPVRRSAPSGSSPSSAGAISPIYEGPLFIALAVASWALTGINRWLVAGFYGETEAGYFTLAGNAAAIAPTIVGVVLMQYFQPGLFTLGDGPAAARPTLARRVDKIALAYNVLAFAAVFAVAGVAPFLVGPWISVAYQPALVWVLPAGCFAISTMTALIYHTLLLAGRRERACAPLDLATAGTLAVGCLAAAAAGPTWLARWLVVTPLIPWILTRPLARRYFFTPAADSTP